MSERLMQFPRLNVNQCDVIQLHRIGALMIKIIILNGIWNSDGCF